MKQRVRKLFGPYSPKVEDNAFMSLMKDGIESSMKGAVIIGDNGYQKAAREFKKIKIVTTMSKPRGSQSSQNSKKPEFSTNQKSQLESSC